MKLIADTHVHVYPCHDSARTFKSLLENLQALSVSAAKALFLTERADCHFFRDLAEGRVEPPVPGTAFSVSAERECVTLGRTEGGDMVIFAGRQIVTRERLEILALTLDQPFPEGETAEAVIAAVLQAGGVPVLSWAPGKWFFGRGRVVASLIERFKPGELLIGDTSLRPIGWPEPILMRRARRAGLTVLAGSDPLPVAGEEIHAGCYASLLDIDLEDNTPVVAIRRAFKSPGLGTKTVGRRSGPFEVWSRLQGHARQAGRPAPVQGAGS